MLAPQCDSRGSVKKLKWGNFTQVNLRREDELYRYYSYLVLLKAFPDNPGVLFADICHDGCIFFIYFSLFFSVSFLLPVFLHLGLVWTCPWRYPHRHHHGTRASPCFHWMRWMPHRHHEIPLAENTPCHHCLGLDNIHPRAVEDYNR